MEKFVVRGRGNLAHMSVWILVFGLMSVIGKTDGKHTGDSLPFGSRPVQTGLRTAVSGWFSCSQPTAVITPAGPVTSWVSFTARAPLLKKMKHGPAPIFLSPVNSSFRRAV